MQTSIPPHRPQPSTSLAEAADNVLAVSCVTSTQRWQQDLQSLFLHAKERFPDVVWELQDEDGIDKPEEVWGHKAIVYARAPQAFQARYFSFRPLAMSSTSSYDLPGAESSLSLALSLPPTAFQRASSASPRPISPALSAYTPPAPTTGSAIYGPTQNGPLLRLTTSIVPALFSDELEHLYTAKGISGEAFEFLFDSTAGDIDYRSAAASEEVRLEKLRHDLVFMWRSKLYSDIRISLTGPFSFGDDGTPMMPDEHMSAVKQATEEAEQQMALFSTHRFILISRAQYFRALLLNSPFAPPALSTATSPTSPTTPSGVDNTPTISLPSPPFTPPSLHFMLGYLYAGTLSFSNRTFDLSTAFAIYRCAVYLSVAPLQVEVETRIIAEFCHGLFYAHLPLDEFERAVKAEDPDGQDWALVGCTCRVCARRVPRVLTFALAPDVKNSLLERGARRALVGMFGEPWSSKEFLGLTPKTRLGLVKTVTGRVNTYTVVRHLGAVRALREAAASQGYSKELEELASTVEKKCNDVVASHAAVLFRSQVWLDSLDGVGFSRMDTVEDVLTSLVRGLTETNAGRAYEALVGEVLLRSNEHGEVVLSQGGDVRNKVEEARKQLLAWLKKRWAGVRLVGGFDMLESWSLKEISDELDVQPEDLITPQPVPVPAPKTRGTTRPAVIASTIPSRVGPDNASETSSLSARRVVAPRISTVAIGASVTAARAPRAPSMLSTATRTSVAPSVGTARSPRPAGRASPSARPQGMVMQNASRVSLATTATTDTTQASTRPVSTLSTQPSTARQPTSVPRPMAPSGKPRSLAPSVSSVRSAASTLRKPQVAAPTPATPRTPTAPRPASGLSIRSEKPTTRTSATDSKLDPGAPRPRKISSGSALSTASAVRARRVSAATTASTTAPKKQPPATPSVVKRPPSTTSVRTTASTGKKLSSAKVAQKDTTPTPPVPPVPVIVRPSTPPNLAPAKDLPGSPRTVASVSTTASTVRASSLISPVTPTKRGITLNVGIPCVITSRRARFRAYARYIGEVAGLSGQWVGVEVRVGPDVDKLDGREWNDGTLNGIRYFELGGGAGEEDPIEEERVIKRRRLDLLGSIHSGTTGSTLSLASDRRGAASPAFSETSTAATGFEGRGLFVQPEQVILVQHAQTL
ncbi:hypothetical protein CALCODRAFT_489830 [Calocera cornea HHB12733]|uniref:CAP-Gly domain-containing protein n=1 Tax=Calocera cornea HHB12733 TaxID=1353952 RepID=A0A165JZF0_9BASI|nr:hypothetical protein CALCODRAFT_489830 [Calocera cornea HHB12733]